MTLIDSKHNCVRIGHSESTHATMTSACNVTWDEFDMQAFPGYRNTMGTELPRCKASAEHSCLSTSTCKHHWQHTPDLDQEVPLSQRYTPLGRAGDPGSAACPPQQSCENRPGLTTVQAQLHGVRCGGEADSESDLAWYQVFLGAGGTPTGSIQPIQVLYHACLSVAVHISRNLLRTRRSHYSGKDTHSEIPC